MRRKTYAKQCEYCNQDFITWNGNPKRFCSYDCGYKNRTSTTDELFLKNLIKNENGCLEYKSRYSNGYGRVSLKNNKFRLAHRYSWEYHFGAIPEGMHVLHKCDNPPCCEISHLFLGTPSENNKDMMDKGRHNTLIGEKSSRAFLTESQVKDIKIKLKNGTKMADLSREYNIGEVAIYSIKTGRSWRHVS